MKTLLILTLVALMAATTFAQDLPENAMGIFFSDVDISQETTNINPAVAVPFAVYLVIVNPTMPSIGGYEVSIDMSALLVTAVEGPNGWQNFGTNTNHLVGYGTPLPASDFVVLCTLTVLALTGDEVWIKIGPSEPSSVGGAGPAIADGANPDDLFVLNLTTCYPEDHPMHGVVATVNGDGVELCEVVATQETSWSNVKGLFE